MPSTQDRLKQLEDRRRFITWFVFERFLESLTVEQLETYARDRRWPESIIEIRAGKLDPKVANALGYLGTSLLRALEVADVERRLNLLEGHDIRMEDMVLQPGDPAGKP